jgi:hypothetical protein
LAVVIYYISIYFDLSLFTLYNTADSGRLLNANSGGGTGGARGALAPPEKSGGLAPQKILFFLEKFCN